MRGSNSLTGLTGLTAFDVFDRGAEPPGEEI